MSNAGSITPVTIGTSGMTLDDVIAVARGGAQVSLSDEAIAAMAATRLQIEALANAVEPVYGVSTGFGALATRHIPAEMRTQLQRSLIRSHAAGMGAPVEREVVRALMLLRLKTLASGRTGVRPVVAQTMAALLNAGITPVVREYGSLGCSGDLAPLSHCALVLMGEGEATDLDGVAAPVDELLARAGISPIELQEKEGLALINGTDGMLGMLIMSIADLEHLCNVADLTAALSVEGLLGTDQVFRPELHLPLRPHPGQAQSAANILAHLDEYMAMHKSVIQKSAGVRRAGSAALDLAYVAGGRLDGFWEMGLAPWDMAAGALLILEAGGLIADFEGNEGYLESGRVVCGNPRIFTQLMQAVAPKTRKG